MSDTTSTDGHLEAFRRDEGYAAFVVEHALRARVERRDGPGAPRGTVDAEIIYPDGHTGALEVTSVEHNGTHHLRNRVDRLQPQPAPGRFMWSIRPGSVAELERLVSIHQRVIALCESHGVLDPEGLPDELIAHDPDLTWLAWEGGGSRISGHEWKHDDPKIWWMYPIESAVFGSEEDEIAEGVAAALKVEPSIGHLEKLLRDKHDERHLFLVVGTTGLSNAAAFALIDSEAIPSFDPELPNGVDHLWLGPGYGGTVTVWSRGRGWRVERLPDAPPPKPRRR